MKPILLPLLLGLPLAAQNPQWPEPGSNLGKAMVYAPSGPMRGQEFDAAARLRKGTGALLFIHALNRETAPIIRALDEEGFWHGLKGLRAQAILLGADRSALETRAKQVSQALLMRQPLCVSLDGAEGPGSYAIQRRVSLTLVLSKDGRLHKLITLSDTGQKDVPMLRRELESLCGKAPRTAAAIRKELGDDPVRLQEAIGKLLGELQRKQAQLTRIQTNRRNQRNRGMRRNQRSGAQTKRHRNNPRVGEAPKDPRLVSQLRSLIQKQNQATDVEAVFRRAAGIIGTDQTLQGQWTEALRLVISLGYGTDLARAQAAAYLKARKIPVPPTGPGLPKRR